MKDILKKFSLLSMLLASSTTLAAQIPASEYVARRNALAASVKDGIVVALGSPEPEQDYIAFNQNSPFIYLTGFLEPDAALVMVVKNGAISEARCSSFSRAIRRVRCGQDTGSACRM